MRVGLPAGWARPPEPQARLTLLTDFERAINLRWNGKEAREAQHPLTPSNCSSVELEGYQDSDFGAEDCKSNMCG